MYKTDVSKIITEINQAFTNFARENWRSDFKPSHLLGKPLLPQISDPSTRQLYYDLLERLQSKGSPIRFPFRCDSPGVRRYMELKVTPMLDGGIEWNSRILREEPREPIPLLDNDLARGECFLSVCSWCKRCSVPDWAGSPDSPYEVDAWIELEDMMQVLGNLDTEKLPQLTHTFCPECYLRVIADVKRQ